MMQYTQDNGECYPRTTNGFVRGGAFNVLSWRRSLEPYTDKSPHLWQCTGPGEPNPRYDVLSPLDELPLCYDVTDTGPVQPRRRVGIGAVGSPATTFLVFEKNGASAEAQLIGVPWDRDSGAAGWTNILYGGHFGSSNYLFADGHVQAFRPLQTIRGADNPQPNGRREWNPWHLNNSDPISPRALQKLQAAERNFPP